MMSPKLQAELQLQVNGRWLASVPFLQGAEEQCLLRIALALRTRVFVPNEVLPSDSLYNLVSGSCTIDGSLIVSGSTWGEDCILYRTDLREEAAAAASYAEVSCIHREALIEIVNTPATTEEFGKEYPIASRRLRWAALGIAIKGLARKNAAGDRDYSGGGGSKRYQRGKWFGTAGSGRQGSGKSTLTLDRLAEPPPQQKAADWVARSEQQARSEHYRDSQEVYRTGPITRAPIKARRGEGARARVAARADGRPHRRPVRPTMLRAAHLGGPHQMSMMMACVSMPTTPRGQAGRLRRMLCLPLCEARDALVCRESRAVGRIFTFSARPASTTCPRQRVAKRVSASLHFARAHLTRDGRQQYHFTAFFAARQLHRRRGVG